MRESVARILFGRPVQELFDYVETWSCDAVEARQLLGLVEGLIDSSLHYCTAKEERAFLARSAEFVNFEGGRLFNRVVITESPDRVIDLIRHHLFDKFGDGEKAPVRLVEARDALDDALVDQMRVAPNDVFIARVTRIPHQLFTADTFNVRWRSVIGRLLLIDDSPRARTSNVTIVYTLFPHVARTLRNIQTSLAGRPANTQLQLRCMLEKHPLPVLQRMRDAVRENISQFEQTGLLKITVDQLSCDDWRRGDVFDYLTQRKVFRLFDFVSELAAAGDRERIELGGSLRSDVAEKWMRYFYKGLPPARYRATVLPGGGRGVLTMVGDFHRANLSELVDQFRPRTSFRLSGED